MKKLITIVGLLVLFAVGLFVVFSNRTPKELSLAPAGFTNNAAGKPEALFVVRNFGPEVTWNIFGLQRKSDVGWRNVSTPMTWSSYRMGNDYVVGVPVSSTSNAWRIILYCQERRKGVPGLVDRGKETYERHVTKRVLARYDGRKYYVTNDVVP